MLINKGIISYKSYYSFISLITYIIIIHFFANIKALICVSSIAISVIATAPLCFNVTNIAGNSLPNSS